MTGEFDTYGHGAEGTDHNEVFESVRGLNEALNELDPFYNLPYSWRYYEDEGVAVEIFMPRKGQTTTFRVPGATADEAISLDRDRLRHMIDTHTKEEAK